MDNKIRKCIKALSDLSVDEKLEDITVFRLIKAANVKRPTFYYYFSSIRDVIVAFYLEFPLQEFKRIRSSNDLLNRIKDHLNANKAFNVCIAQSAQYQSVLLEQVFQWAHLYYKEKFQDVKARFIAYGFASVFVNIYAREGTNYAELLRIVNAFK